MSLAPTLAPSHERPPAMRTLTADLATGPAPTWATVTVDDSNRWLHAAIDDMRHNPRCTMLYGALAVVSSWAVAGVLLVTGLGAVMLPLASGFMLIGAMFAVPLHVTARAREAGERISLIEAIRRSRPSLPGLAMIGIVLTLIMLSWMMLAMLVFALFYGGTPLGLSGFASALLSSPQAAIFLTTGTLVGAAMASAAFAVAALAIPLLVDRPYIQPVHAMAVSIEGVARQPGVMLGWGATLGFITLAGMLPGFLGLAFTLPLAGYASWHAYRGLLPKGI